MRGHPAGMTVRGLGSIRNRNGLCSTRFSPVMRQQRPFPAMQRDGQVPRTQHVIIAPLPRGPARSAARSSGPAPLRVVARAIRTAKASSEIARRLFPLDPEPLQLIGRPRDENERALPRFRSFAPVERDRQRMPEPHEAAHHGPMRRQPCPAPAIVGSALSRGAHWDRGQDSALLRNGVPLTVPTRMSWATPVRICRAAVSGSRNSPAPREIVERAQGQHGQRRSASDQFGASADTVPVTPRSDHDIGPPVLVPCQRLPGVHGVTSAPSPRPSRTGRFACRSLRLPPEAGVDDHADAPSGRFRAPGLVHDGSTLPGLRGSPGLGFSAAMRISAGTATGRPTRASWTEIPTGQAGVPRGRPRRSA